MISRSSFSSGLLAVGLLLAILGIPPSAPAQQITYEYDALGRLTVVTSPEGIAQYSYDAVGNILQITTRRFADVSGPVAILLVNPTKGAPGTEVRLYGKGFATTPADNQVAFNGTPAAVTTATATSLTTSVSAGATSGPISLTTPLGSAVSPDPFTVLQGFVVIPDQADVALGGTLGFQATQGGTPLLSGVTWRVNGIVGGNGSLGTITSEGLYTAPMTPPAVQPLRIEAVLTADPAQVATATVRVVGQASGLGAAAPVSVAVVPRTGPVASVPVSVQVTSLGSPVASIPVAVSGGPLVRSVSPTSGPVSANNLPVTLTGGNLQGASLVQFLRNGFLDGSLTAGSLVPSGDGTSLSLTLTISGSAVAGPRVVQVVTPQGTSTNFDIGTNVFTVTAP